MSTQQTQQAQQQPAQTPKKPSGGVEFIGWVLGGPASSFVSKATGEPKSVIELRDPSRLRNSLVIFLDGEPGALAQVEANTVVTLRVDEVRKGASRGELIADVGREAVEAAFARAGSGS